MESKITVRFDALEVVGKMIEILTEQYQGAIKASAEEDDEFEDWPSINSTFEPDSDPILSVHRFHLAQALLADNGIDVNIYRIDTEIDEDCNFIVRYWE